MRLVSAIVLGICLAACGGHGAPTNSDAENATSAQGAVITFGAVPFDPKNPGSFEGVVTGSVRAGTHVTVKYDPARLQKNGISCAPGAPLRMGQKVNLDPS